MIQVGKPLPSTFDDISFPETVYKYRNANDKYHLEVLSERILYFAPPSSFEDEMDCRNPLRYDLLSKKEIFDLTYRIISDYNPKWNEARVIQETAKSLGKGLFRNSKYLKEYQEYSWVELNKRLGILSLTANPSNISMWNKYANNLEGFCVGFDPKVLFKTVGGGGEVQYCDALPIIKPTDPIERQITLLTYCKLKKWEFEEEYRTQQFWDHEASVDERKLKVLETCFTEIIIGERVKPKMKTEILRLSESINPKIRKYKAELNGNQIDISPIECTENY